MVMKNRSIVYSFLNKFNLIKCYHIKFSILLILFIGISLTTNLHAKPRYNKAHTYYNDPNILMYSQRVEVGVRCKLQSVDLKLYSEKQSNRFRFRIFGYESGNSIPIYERDMIKPLICSKDSCGVSLLKIELPEEIEINEGQFFICLDSMSEGLHWVSSDKEIKKYCKSQSGEYLRQAMKLKNSGWMKGKYNFVYDCIYDKNKHTLPSEGKSFLLGERLLQDWSLWLAVPHPRRNHFPRRDFRQQGIVATIRQ